MITRQRCLLALFVATSFVGAGLLFLSEPMVGKLLLPVFGGTPMVWNTCMVFFQTLLLAGYLYAHWSLQVLGMRRQMVLHGVLLLVSLAALPLALPAWAGNGVDGQPLAWLLALLAVVVGAPFFLLSTSGPLLQRWFANTPHPHAKQPYFLYAAGNLGSFLALLAYPFVVEPLLSLRQQSRVWSVAYVSFLVLIGACMVLARRPGPHIKPAAATTSPRPSWRRRMVWMFYAFIPSSLMLGVTTKVTLDIAAVPLLWIIPLALYLLTFVVAFGTGKPGRLAEKAAPFAAAGLGGALVLLIAPFRLPWTVAAGAYFTLFALIALVAHARLAESRPAPARLTEFYVWVAVGGMLGGVGNTLLAPLIFNDIIELPLALALAAIAVVGVQKIAGITDRDTGFAFVTCAIFSAVLTAVIIPISWLPLVLATCAAGLLFRFKPIALGIGIMPLFLVPLLRADSQPTLFIKRTFYGVVKIRENSTIRVLTHGTTVHGSQYIAAEKSQEPTAYYHRKGPLGDTLRHCRVLNGCRRVAAVGLGAGTVAAYGQEGDTMTFYEIDPLIIDIATKSQYFSYIPDSKATVKTILGDARLSLGRTNASYEAIVLDAFSSDAIPAHLLTREAVQLYQQRLTEHGLLAVHISNRNLNLEPVVAAIAREQGLVAITRLEQSRVTSQDDPHSSRWVVLAKHQEDLQPLLQQPGWQTVRDLGMRAWTDDYSNIFDTLHKP